MTARTITGIERLTLTEYAVLGLLGDVGRPISGYDLGKLAASTVGYIWQPSKTQLYAVLPRLVDAGLARRREVAQRGKPDKQLYTITAAGRVAIRDWLGRDDETRDPDRSVLVLKLFFGDQGERAALLRQVRAFRDGFAERLATYERIRDRRQARIGSSKKEPPDYRLMTVRYGIARATAAVEWAEDTLKALESGAETAKADDHYGKGEADAEDHSMPVV